MSIIWTQHAAQRQREWERLRVPFTTVEEGRKVLTVYWTSKVSRYWEVE